MTVWPRASTVEHRLGSAGLLGDRALEEVDPRLGLYPIVTSQYSSTALCQVSYHVQYLFFYSDNRIYPYGHRGAEDVEGEA